MNPSARIAAVIFGLGLTLLPVNPQQASPTFKVFGKQGNDLVVMDGHKVTHRGLSVFKEFNFNWALWH